METLVIHSVRQKTPFFSKQGQIFPEVARFFQDQH